MENKTIIEIDFNENLEREGQRFYFNYLWRKQFNGLKKIILFTVVFLGLGFYPLKNFEQSALYYIFRYGGVFLVIYMLLIIFQYYKSKKKFSDKIEENILEFKDKNITKTFIMFTEQNIKFQNSINNISSIWEKTSYLFVGKYVLVRIMNNSISYVFSKNEFKNDDYETLVSFFEKYSTKKD